MTSKQRRDLKFYVDKRGQRIPRRNAFRFPTTTALQRRITRYLREKWFRALLRHRGQYIGRCPICLRDGQARYVALDARKKHTLQAAARVADAEGVFRWNAMLVEMGLDLDPGYAELAYLGLIEPLHEHEHDAGRWRITPRGRKALKRSDDVTGAYVFDNRVLSLANRGRPIAA